VAKKLKREFEKVMGHIDEMCEILESADEYRALVALKALKMREKMLLERQDEVVRVLGVDNIGNAITKIKTLRMGALVSETLPEELSTHPPIWQRGRVPTKLREGFAPYSFFQAEKLYKRLRPYLVEAWGLTFTRDVEQGELLREQILESYVSTSPEEMAQFCHSFINDYEIEEVIEGGQVAVERGVSTIELQRVLNNLRTDYGVTAKEQIEEGR
jgi:hypothetical protein